MFKPVCLEGFQVHCSQRNTCGNSSSGANQEQTLKDNLKAFKRWVHSLAVTISLENKIWYLHFLVFSAQEPKHDSAVLEVSVAIPKISLVGSKSSCPLPPQSECVSYQFCIWPDGFTMISNGSFWHC